MQKYSVEAKCLSFLKKETFWKYGVKIPEDLKADAFFEIKDGVERSERIDAHNLSDQNNALLKSLYLAIGRTISHDCSGGNVGFLRPPPKLLW